MEIPLLGMGTGDMGRTFDKQSGTFVRDESTVHRSLKALGLGLSLGLSLIDTAELYGDGLTEEIVGQAIKGHPRESVFIITKVWKTHLGYADTIRAAEASLARLKSSYIDLYLVHWPNPGIPLSETMRAMEQLLADGVVHSIGVSNFSVEQMQEASRLLKNARIQACEIEYGLSHQEPARDIIPYCRENDINVIAYRPLGRGTIAKAPTSNLSTLSKKYGKTPNQLALAWIMAQGITAIPASLNPEHILENCDARTIHLSREDRESLTVYGSDY